MAAKGSSFPLLKIQEQLTCGKCHNLYTNPKTLSCHHSFCQQCIEGLPTIPTLFVACPTCHQHTELPDHVGSAGFSVAPQVVELRQIYEEMRKLSGEVKCDNCSNADASGYCKDCNQSLCKECIEMHKKWAPFAKHVILGFVEALKAPTNEAPINKEVAPHVKTILSVISGREAEIKEQGEAVKEEIRSFVKRLMSSVSDKLIREVDETVDRKLEMLEKQKKESLNASHEVSGVHPIEKTDIQFIKSNNESISHHVGSVVSSAGLEECKVKEITTIKHIPQEKAISFIIELRDDKEDLLALPASSLSLNVVPANKPHPVINARVIPTDKPGVYQVICNPVIRGQHQVFVRAFGVQLKQSSFVIPFNPYTDQVITPIRTIHGLNSPYGVAVHDDGRIVVSENDPYVVSILSKERKKGSSFGNGANNITFSGNRDLAITDDGYVLVADASNHRIQKISMDGQYVTSVGSNGTEQLKFNFPSGIAISQVKKHIYIVECHGHRVQVLNGDLTFCRVFGKEGTGNGEFKNPRNFAIDSEGLVYVADHDNHRIQKFTHDDKYLSQFGNEGTGPGQLKSPSGITIDNAGLVYVSEVNNSRVSVFTTDGTFVRTFGENGIKEDQF